MSNIDCCKGNLGSKMADLLTDRTIDEPPFTNCSVDMFGPFLIKERRKELKRYGILFTYLSGRAVHIECACSLETDSFIQALHCFVAQRRGNIRVLCSDNGSNVVEAQKELEKAYKEMDYQKTEFFLQNIGADYINWHRTLPPSLHQAIWGVFGKDKFSQYVQ